MQLAEIVRADGAQLVKLPEGFQLEGDIVSIRRQGQAIVLEPVKSAIWPPGFFEKIQIDDPAFASSPGASATSSKTGLSCLRDVHTCSIRTPASPRCAITRSCWNAWLPWLHRIRDLNDHDLRIVYRD